jgi:phosphotriesterase-related protein
MDVSRARLARRRFLGLLAGAVAVPTRAREEPGACTEVGQVLTVSGAVAPARLGKVLAHEHVLVDFVGADKITRDRYDAEEAFRTILPHLRALRGAGCDTLVECTPAYLGRDPRLLQRLSDASGLAVLTNTGYYGAGNDRYLPAHAFRESAQELAARWTTEFRAGIEGTTVRPGFMKIGVDSGPLSAVDRKLVEAAALCHERTGLTIYVHTGDGQAALGTMETLRAARIALPAYVWVHAQNEKDREIHVQAARQGAWVSFDGVSPESLDRHVEAVLDMTRRGYLARLLVSQDAGWYRVGEPGGGAYRGHTFLFESFVPALRGRGFPEDALRTLLVTNPAEALTVRVRTA